MLDQCSQVDVQKIKSMITCLGIGIFTKTCQTVQIAKVTHENKLLQDFLLIMYIFYKIHCGNNCASLAKWSACLTTNEEIMGMIPGSSTLKICISHLGLEQGPPNFMRTVL